MTASKLAATNVEVEANALSASLLALATAFPSQSALDSNTSKLLSDSAPVLAHLRALARDVADESRAAKAHVAERRTELDKAKLRLQNVKYERGQLEGEIRRCREFVSVYQDIELHSVEEFEQLAPEELRTEEILADPHKLMLARLQFELLERRRLEEEKRALLSTKAALVRANREKQARLKAAQDEIHKMIAAGKALPDQLSDF